MVEKVQQACKLAEAKVAEEHAGKGIVIDGELARVVRFEVSE